MCSSSHNGVFWFIDGVLLAVPFDKDKYPDALAKSGNTYNHKKLWDMVKPHGCGKPFDYYPRGRIVIAKSGKVIIYMNPNIGDNYISDIRAAFGIEGDAEIRYDFTKHYKCFLDR